MRRTPPTPILYLMLALSGACEPTSHPTGMDESPAPVAGARDLTALVRWSGPATVAPPAAPLIITARAELATGTVVYDAVPDPFPGAYPSLGFHQTQSDEWGDHVLLTQGGPLGSVTVGLSSWACENDPVRAPGEACITTPGATFTHPVTVNLYAVDLSGGVPAVGPLLATKTRTFELPYRPSWDATNCLPPAYNAPFGGQWFDPVLGQCVDGLAVAVDFDFTGQGIEVPDQVIYGVAFDTETAGATPVGAPGPYNALTVGVANYLTSPPPSVGSDAEPDYTFWDTALAGWYCDGGAGGVDVFRRDGCWGGITPVIRIALGPAEEPVASGSVNGSGWWREPGSRGGPPARLTVAAGYRGAETLAGQVDVSVPREGLRMRSQVLTSLTVSGSRAALEGEGTLDGQPVLFELTVEAGTGEGGADVMTLVIRTPGPGGSVVFETGGPTTLSGSVRVRP